MWQFSSPWVGILIPSLLISGIGLGSLFFIFRHHMSPESQLGYLGLMILVGISYSFAILTPPGSPPKDYKPQKNQWKVWCNKCNLYKPPRTHHCKQCKTCVLAMDHHCPWTNNCVGHGNLPHFMRFLIMVLVGTGYTLYGLSLRAYEFYEDRDLPAYLIDRSELAAVIVLLLVDGFVFFAIVVLFLRCIINISSGKTQIEVWEMERIEGQFHTERLWYQIRKNYKTIHGSELPKLTSWNVGARYYQGDPLEDIQEENIPMENLNSDENDDQPPSLIPDNFTPDDIIFPYDLGFFSNFVTALGYPWNFILFWGKAPGNGYEFKTNDDDDQLNLPWPPDGGQVDFIPREYTDEDLRALGDVSLIKKHLDPRSNMKRSEWVNDMGETLQDYGVDVDEEEQEELVVNSEVSSTDESNDRQ
ncbi:hypothetical protein FDK38_001265 [Candidozyma auris]|nr:hypothetical protein FDK38_001265 [[Candida] auris]